MTTLLAKSMSTENVFVVFCTKDNTLYSLFSHILWFVYVFKFDSINPVMAGEGRGNVKGALFVLIALNCKLVRSLLLMEK